MKICFPLIAFAIALSGCRNETHSERAWTGPHPFGKTYLYLAQDIAMEEPLKFGLTGVRDEIQIGPLKATAVVIDDDWTEVTTSSGTIIRIRRGSFLVLFPNGSFRTLKNPDELKQIPPK